MKEPKAKGNRLRLVWRFMRGSRFYFVSAIVFAVLVSFTELINPKIVGVTVDSVLGSKPPEGLYSTLLEFFGGSEYLRSHLYVVSLVIVAVALVAVVFRYLFRLSNVLGAETLVENVRNQVFRHIEHLPFSWHMKNNTGDIIQRCTSDIDMVKRFLSEQLTSIFNIIMKIFLSLIFMLSINPTLSIVPIVAIPVIITYSVMFHGKIGRGFAECDENEGVLSAIVQENLTGVRVVRAFGREKYEREKFSRQNEKYTGLWTRLMRLMSAFWAFGDLVSGIQLMLVIVLGVSLAVKGQLTAGDFITFVSYNAMLMWPVRQLGRMISELSKAGISMERIAYIMDSPLEADAPDATDTDMKGDIAFEHVSYAYEGSQQVLDDVTFTVKAGETVGILGGTCSGKSTLMHLLTRLYDLPAENGRITVGGKDIAHLTASSVRRSSGIVLQEPYLFSRSLAENIGIAEEGATLTDIRRAAAIACLDSTIEGFTDGYDTFVGERGVTLSGGQKQRAAIARMLTRETPVMIFDDSLSAVDAETDAKIRRAINENLGGSTVFIISHRITTLMHADKIVVLDGGRVAEMGTHDELVASDGIYKKIYDIQLSGMADGEEESV